SVGNLERFNSGFELSVRPALREVHLVHRLQQIQLPALLVRRTTVFEKADHRLRIDGRVVDVRPLVYRGQETVRPELWADDRLARAEDDVAWQILVLGPKPGSQPS